MSSPEVVTLTPLVAVHLADVHPPRSHQPRTGSHPPLPRELSSKVPSPFQDPVAEGTACAEGPYAVLPSRGAVEVLLQHKAHTHMNVTEEVTHPLAAPKHSPASQADSLRPPMSRLLPSDFSLQDPGLGKERFQPASASFLLQTLKNPVYR